MIYKTQQANTQHVKIFRALAVEVKWLVFAEDWGFYSANKRPKSVL